MPSIFSISEYVDMLLIYGEVGKKSKRAAILYQQRYPERSTPSPRTFQSVEFHLRTTGK